MYVSESWKIPAVIPIQSNMVSVDTLYKHDRSNIQPKLKVNSNAL